MSARWTRRCLLISIASLLLTACSNGTGSVEERPPTQAAEQGFTLGGNVTGLSGQGLVIQNNGGSDLTIAANGAFTFNGSLPAASSYNVTVRTQPAGPAQLCTVSNGSGNITANVNNINITCNNSSGAFAVRGTVTGLAAQGLVLQNNGTDDLAISTNGTFSFPLTIATGAPYNVTVRTQPASPAQTCTVANATGTMGAADVTNVAVTCSSGAISIGVTVTGLQPGSSVGLTNNGNDNLTANQNGQFVFSRAVPTGSPYFVTVSSHPTNPRQSCIVTNGSGVAGTINVTDIVVTCSANYTVGGTITGLVGSGLTLQLNGANTLTVPPGTQRFAFSTFVNSGSTYNVTIGASPANPAQTCTVANATGTVTTSDVTNIAVTCVVPTHFIGGTVSGLRGTGLVLRNNDQEEILIRSDGEFTFPTKLEYGSSYTVAVKTQPTAPLQECTPANNQGKVTGDVRNIQITCATKTYPLSVSVTGLLGSGIGIKLYNNGSGTPLDAPTNGNYTFAEQVANGSPYNVTVDPSTQPKNPTQACAPSPPGSGAGIMGTQAVTVNIVCTTSSFTLSGVANNLVGTGLVLENQASGTTLAVSTSSFQFPPILSGSAYNIRVLTQPSNPAQECTLTNGSGTVSDRNIDNLRVDCVTTEFTIGGQISNLLGSGLQLQNNGADTLPIGTSGPFTFRASLRRGATYNVTVLTQPSVPAQDCVVANGTGTVADVNITNVQITCTTIEFTVGGNVTGLSGAASPGSSVVLHNNGISLEVASDGPFVFPPVRTGQSYNVTVQTQPSSPARLCSVVNGSGIMGSAPIDNVQVFCIALPFFP